MGVVRLPSVDSSILFYQKPENVCDDFYKILQVHGWVSEIYFGRTCPINPWEGKGKKARKLPFGGIDRFAPNWISTLYSLKRFVGVVRLPSGPRAFCRELTFNVVAIFVKFCKHVRGGLNSIFEVSYSHRHKKEVRRDTFCWRSIDEGALSWK